MNSRGEPIPPEQPLAGGLAVTGDPKPRAGSGLGTGGGVAVGADGRRSGGRGVRRQTSSAQDDLLNLEMARQKLGLSAKLKNKGWWESKLAKLLPKRRAGRPL